jgi:hypothetical protein
MTAVEWLEQKIKANPFRIENDRLWNEAKEMEKEQIINTWTEATTPDHEIGLSDASYIISQIQKAEQYYNETFNNK